MRRCFQQTLKVAAPMGVQQRHQRSGSDRAFFNRQYWYKLFPEITEERYRDMYHCYYPYLFEHGEKMSLYPKIPDNPREWQPHQLLTTYDAIREDKYDAFLKLREKFPELYQDTQAWDNPRPFGDFNMFYSARFGMIGTKVFTINEYDDLGNKLELTALWCPDNQVVAHRHNDTIVVGAMNVPAEFHKPHITAAYKARRLPVKHVSTSWHISADAYAPVGTELDVRHFKVGQEVKLHMQYTDFGLMGITRRHGLVSGTMGDWLGDSKFKSRPGSVGSEGAKRIWPQRSMHGQAGAFIHTIRNAPIYRIDYKHQIIYVVATLPADVGCYVRISDEMNVFNKVSWNANRGFPPFPTFVPPPGEDLSNVPTEECQLVSGPLLHHFKDEGAPTTLVSQADLDDARAIKPAAPAAKKKVYELHKVLEERSKRRKQEKDDSRKDRKEKADRLKERQAELTRKKFAERRKVK